MPTYQTTTGRAYPLPYPSNLLADDVQRLRDALQAIDNDIVARPTNSAVQGLVDQTVASLVQSAPATLDTLNELAAALGDDANFAATIATQFAGVESAVEALETELQAQVTALSGVVTALTTWQIVTSNATAAANSRLFVKTSSNALTITLPSDPVLGTYVQIVDATSTFLTNNCTVARSGSLIMGLAEDLVLNVKNAFVTLVFSDASSGWRIS